jgi:outer membrane protein TolC
MIGSLILLTAAAMPVSSQDTIPVVTLTEALAEAVGVDPNYVQAVGQLETAEWGRRAAKFALFLPTLSATAGYSQFSASQFNLGTSAAASTAGMYSLNASYTLFRGGSRIQDSRRSKEELEVARAGVLGQRFLTALQTERDYYDVLGNTELLQVAEDRFARAQSQFSLARARVLSGATVQSDSLQILLELQRAETFLIASEAALEVAQLQLGRRIGSGGPVDAAPLGDDRVDALPMTLGEAIHLAVSQGPTWRASRASERSAEAALKSQRGNYLPTISLNGSLSAFDDKFVPTATSRRSIGINLSWSIWDGGRRELAIEQLKVQRNVARAIRSDLERAARRDVTEAYTGYDVARRTLSLSRTAVSVAAEVLRVQQARYQGGESTVLEMLDAQAQLVQAQADLVQARYGVRLARATLEAILGQRLDTASAGSQP